jgi:hypothetical protein
VEPLTQKEGRSTMYKVERKTSGYLLTFEGNIDLPEMEKFYKESENVLSREFASEFCVIVDMKKLNPLPPVAQQRMIEGQKLYLDKGMKRSSVIVNNAITSMQFKRIAKESGIDQWERYFDGSDPKAMEAAIAWGRDAKDPDA